MASWLRKTVNISIVPTLSKWNFQNGQQGVLWSTCAWLIGVYSCPWYSEVRAARAIGIRSTQDDPEAQQCMPPMPTPDQLNQTLRMGVENLAANKYYTGV